MPNPDSNSRGNPQNFHDKIKTLYKHSIETYAEMARIRISGKGFQATQVTASPISHLLRHLPVETSQIRTVPSLEPIIKAEYKMTHSHLHFAETNYNIINIPDANHCPEVSTEIDVTESS